MNILAIAAAVVLTVLVILDYIGPNATPEEGEALPWGYDLALAYLAGWFFHLLVVVLPEKRKEEALLRSLRGHLMLIADNGHDLIRELGQIANCPPRQITQEHLTKVLTALNDTPAVRSFIASRFRITEDAFNSLIPYMAALPLPLQLALQRENQRTLRSWSGRHYDPTANPSLKDLRAESEEVQEHLATGQGLMATRRHFGHMAKLFDDYYRSTQAVKAELPEVVTRMPEPDGFLPATPKKILLFVPGKERQNDSFTYPPTAESDKPLSVLTGEYRQTDLPPQEEEPTLPIDPFRNAETRLTESQSRLPVPLLKLLTFIQPRIQRLADTLPTAISQRGTLPEGDPQQQ